MRELGIIKLVIKIIDEFPSEESTLTILKQVIMLVNLCATENVDNQKLFHSSDLYTILISKLNTLLKMLNSSGNNKEEIYSVCKLILTCITNSVIANNTNKNDLIQSGKVKLIFQMIDNPQCQPLIDDLLYILINITEGNVLMQNAYSSQTAIFNKLLIPGSTSVNASILLSHALYNHKENQLAFCTPSILNLYKPLLILKKETPMQSYQYYIMAIVSLQSTVHENVQKLIDEKVIDLLLSQTQVQNPACIAQILNCVSNIVASSSKCAEYIASSDYIKFIFNLINDEDEDELSKKAFDLLSKMGSSTINYICSLLKLNGAFPQSVPFNYSLNGAIMGKKEHVAEYIKFDKENPTMREFEKPLIILNGLVYTKRDLRKYIGTVSCTFIYDFMSCPYINMNVRSLILCILSNITMDKREENQMKFVKLEIMRLLASTIAWCDSQLMMGYDKDEKQVSIPMASIECQKEMKGMACDILVNLTYNNKAATEKAKEIISELGIALEKHYNKKIFG